MRNLMDRIRLTNPAVFVGVFLLGAWVTGVVLFLA